MVKLYIFFNKITLLLMLTSTHIHYLLGTKIIQHSIIISIIEYTF